MSEEEKVIEKAKAVISLLVTAYGKDGELVGGYRVKEFVELKEAIEEMEKSK